MSIHSHVSRDVDQAAANQIAGSSWALGNGCVSFRFGRRRHQHADPRFQFVAATQSLVSERLEI
jgi:hypothetical protein